MWSPSAAALSDEPSSPTGPCALVREERLLTTSRGHVVQAVRWALPAGVPLRAAVVFFHGNNSYMSGTHAGLAARLAPLGVQLFGYDQHSYGRSVGLPGDADHGLLVGALQANVGSHEAMVGDAVDVAREVAAAVAGEIGRAHV